MNSIATMMTGRKTSSMVSAFLAVVEPGLQSLELGVDLLRIPQLGNLFLERLGRSAERQRVGPALGKIGVTLQHVEARECLVDLRAGIDFAHPYPLVGALQPRLDRILAG